MNFQNQRDFNGNLMGKLNKPSPNNYQPSLYQNNNNNLPPIGEQAKVPYNFSAQININKKKSAPIEQEFTEPRRNLQPLAFISNNNGNEGGFGNQLFNLEGKNKEENLQEITRRHEELINLILSEEEEVISLHRQHIDDMVDLIKQEMVLLHEVDKPASDVDEYVDSLDAMLSHKLEMIEMLKGKLHNFRSHLKEEESLSKKFHEQKNEMMDIFDLNNESDKEEDVQLLSNLQQVI